MIPEEMERTMQFILEHQARLTATVESIAVKVDRNTEGINALLAAAEIQAHEIEAQGRQIEAQGRQIEAQGRQIEAQGRQIKELGESVRAVDGRQRESDELRRESDERLNALVNTVERYISERRNGKS